METEPIIREPGKFDGEPRYVPFFWGQYLDGWYDVDDGTYVTFNVTKEDRMIFPELRRRRCVRLVERDDGFVCEVRP